MKTTKTFAFVLTLALLVSSFAAPAFAAPTAVERVSIGLGKNEVLRFAIFNNDVAVPGAASSDFAVVRLYNTRNEMLLETERIEVPRGEARPVDFEGVELARFGTDRFGRVHVLVEVEFTHGAPGRKGARWQTSIDVFSNDGNSLIGLLLPAVQKVREAA